MKEKNEFLEFAVELGIEAGQMIMDFREKQRLERIGRCVNLGGQSGFTRKTI